MYRTVKYIGILYVCVENEITLYNKCTVFQCKQPGLLDPPATTGCKLYNPCFAHVFNVAICPVYSEWIISFNLISLDWTYRMYGARGARDSAINLDTFPSTLAFLVFNWYFDILHCWRRLYEVLKFNIQWQIICSNTEKISLYQQVCADYGNSCQKRNLKMLFAFSTIILYRRLIWRTCSNI